MSIPLKNLKDFIYMHIKKDADVLYEEEIVKIKNSDSFQMLNIIHGELNQIKNANKIKEIREVLGHLNYLNFNQIEEKEFPTKKLCKPEQIKNNSSIEQTKT